MYNEELKRRFIDDYAKSDNVKYTCENLFNLFEKHENKWGADLCTVDKSLLQSAIDEEINGIRARGVEYKYSVLRSYVRWCMSNRIEDVSKAIFDIKTVGVDDMRIRTVSSPLHLKMFLDSFFKPDELNSQESIYRCFYWLAFMGMDSEDAIITKVKDVDLSNMIVNDEKNLQTYPIYWESIQSFRNCALLDYFMVENAKTILPIKTDRIDNDYLLRSTKGKSVPTIQSFRSSLTRFSSNRSSKSEMELTYNRVKISGIFYRSFLDEAIGIIPDFKKVAYAEELKKTKDGKVMPDKLKRRVYSYKLDYDRWKLAWYYRS